MSHGRLSARRWSAATSRRGSRLGGITERPAPAGLSGGRRTIIIGAVGVGQRLREDRVVRREPRLDLTSGPALGIFLWSRAAIWAAALFALYWFEPHRRARLRPCERRFLPAVPRARGRARPCLLRPLPARRDRHLARGRARLVPAAAAGGGGAAGRRRSSPCRALPRRLPDDALPPGRLQRVALPD